MTTLETSLLVSSGIAILGLVIAILATLCSSKASSPAYRIGSTLAVVGIVSLCVSLVVGMLPQVL